MLKKLILASAMFLGLGIFGAASVSAFSITSNERAYMGPDQVVDGSMYTAGSTVEVAGTVNGDLFCAGQNVEITGTVNGDVLCAAQQIRVAGTVNGDVRIAAQIVDIDSKITGSLTAFGQAVRINKDANIGRDATVMAQTMMLNGQIGRDLVGSGGMVSFNGPIGGSVGLNVESLTLGSAAAITGTLSYTSTKEATVQQGAITGGTVRTQPEEPVNQKTTASLAAQSAVALYYFLAMMLVGIAIILVRPQIIEATAERIRREPWSVLGWGLVGVFITPIVAVIVALSIIGVPLTFVLLLAYVLVLAVSSVFSGHAMGRLILNQSSVKMSPGWLRAASLALGLFILAVLSLIPVVNTLVGVLALLFGAGSLLQLLRNRPAATKVGAGGV